MATKPKQFTPAEKAKAITIIFTGDQNPLEYENYREESDRRALAQEVEAMSVPDASPEGTGTPTGPTDVVSEATPIPVSEDPDPASGNDDLIRALRGEVEEEEVGSILNRLIGGKFDLSEIDQSELADFLGVGLLRPITADLSTERVDRLTAGPGPTFRDVITDKLPEGFAKSRFRAGLEQFGLLDFVPGVDVGLAIDDLNNMFDKRAQGVDVSFEEEVGLKLALPLSVLGLGAVGKQAGKGVGKLKSLVKGLFPAKPSIVDQIEAEAKAVAESQKLDKNIAKERKEKFVEVTAEQSEETLQELQGFLSWVGDDVAQYLPNKVMNINLERMAVTDDLKAVNAVVADNITIPKDVKTWGETSSAGVQLADELGVDSVWLRETYERLGKVDEEVYAARVMLAQSSYSLRKTVQAYDTAATTAEKARFLASVQNHVNNMRHAVGIVAAPGRALNSQKLAVGLETGNLDSIDEVMQAFGEGKVDNLAAALKRATTPDDLNAIAKRGLNSNGWDTITELYINSILSGVKTLTINATGNALFTAWQVPEAAIAGTIGSIRAAAAKIGGKPEPIDRAYIGESAAMMYGMIEGFWDGVKSATKAVATGTPAVPGDPMRVEGLRQKAISSENLNLSGLPGMATDFVGAIVRTPTTLMLGQDEFFKSIGRRMEINKQAYSHAMKSGGSFRDKATALHRFKSDIPDEALKDADEFARYITFQSELGPTGKKMQALSNVKISRMQIPVFKFIVPFVRTPINIFKAGALERNPIFAPLSMDYKNAIKSGGATADAANAKIASGAMLSSYIGYQAMQGNITGSGPSDPRQQKAWQRAGFRPYSMRIETGQNEDGSPIYEWRQFSRVEPVSFVAGAVADLMGYVKYHDQDDPTRENEITNAYAMMVAVVAENTTNKTFLSGASDFFNLMEDPTRYAERWTQRFASSLVVPNIVRDFAVADDPYMREMTSILDAIKAKTPGFSKELPPKRNVWGEPREHDKGWLFGLQGTYLPIRIGEESQKPIDKEIVRLGVDGVMNSETGQMQVFREALVQPPSRVIKGVRLDDWQYDRLITLSGDEVELDVLGTGELTQTKAMDELVKSKLYKGVQDASKATLINWVHTAYNKAAIVALTDEDEVLRASISDLSDFKTDVLRSISDVQQTLQ